VCNIFVKKVCVIGSFSPSFSSSVTYDFDTWNNVCEFGGGDELRSFSKGDCDSKIGTVEPSSSCEETRDQTKDGSGSGWGRVSAGFASTGFGFGSQFSPMDLRVRISETVRVWGGILNTPVELHRGPETFGPLEAQLPTLTI
jgi:hypothetical protein